MKAFLNVFSERQYRIQNMSSNLRIGDDQLHKYYDMLIPICEKLQIDVPELYVTLDVMPNAYTAGDTKPFIVVTSGLLEKFDDRLIATVLAHECGHIACHHCLYLTLARTILNGGTAFLTGFAQLVTMPLQVALYYWMRCSEYSADRAAAVYTGGAGSITEMCMRFAGYDEAFTESADKEAFLRQAVDYKAMIEDSKWNKTLEFVMLMNATHPFVSVRAYEINDWVKTDEFKEILKQYSIPASVC